MGSSKKQTIGHEFYMGLHMGLCRGPIDELLEARVGDRRAWAGRERREKFFLSGGGLGRLFRVGVNVIPDNSIVVDGNETVYIDAPDLFGGSKKEGGIQGPMQVLMGGPTQVAPSGLSAMLGGLVPGFRGFVSLFFDGLIGAMNPYPKVWKFRVRRTNKGWDNDEVWYPEKAAIWLGTGQSHAGIRAMNPAHILYELWTNRDWGRGWPASRLDLTSFQAAADQLYAEGFGLCLTWARQESIAEYMQIVMDHIGAACGPDLSTGKVRLKLIRDNYVASALPLFDYDSGLLGIDEEQSSATDVITNEITVNWFDPTTKRQRQTAPVQNLGSIQAVGRHSSVRSYPGLPTASLAARVAARDLKASSRALKRYKVRLDRRGYQIQPGDVFRISDPDRGLQSVVLRAGRVEEGAITEGTITITAVQDVFGLPATVLVEEQEPEENPDDLPAPPVTVSRLIEQPYYEIVQTTDPANFSLLTSASGFVAGIAAMPASYASDFLIYSRAGAADYTAKGDAGDWCPNALSTNSVAATTVPVAVALSSVVNLDFVDVGTPALWDDEILIVDDIDTTAETVTLLRGCADTVSRPHAAGSRIWFYEGNLGKDSTEYLTGENVDVKLITVTPDNFLDPADAPELTHTINQRFARPYAPGNFKVNGSAYPTYITGNLTVSWAHRDRVLQADQLIDAAAASVGPEPGTTYTVRVYDDNGDLIETEAGLSGTSWTYLDEGGGAADPHFASVVSLLNFNGLDDSTVFTDVTGKTWTATGSAKLSTEQSQFGGSSLELTPGAETRIDCTHSDFNFGTGDFTIEGFSRPGATSGRSVFSFGSRLVYAGSGSWIYFNGGNAIMGGAVAATSFTHLALVRSAGTVTLFVAGTPVGSTSDAGAMNPGTMRLGYFNGGNPSSQYVDAFRVTKGVARYTEAFTPPSAEYPQEAGELNSRLRVTVEAVRGGLTSWQAHDHTFDRAGYGLNYGLYYGAGV